MQFTPIHYFNIIKRNYFQTPWLSVKGNFLSPETSVKTFLTSILMDKYHSCTEYFF